MKKSKFELLRTKSIISIIDGDIVFGEYQNEDGILIKIKVPYLSGPDLCELSVLFGLPVSYSFGGGALSRWQYLDNLLAYCIKEDKVSELLSYIFAKDRFIDELKGLSSSAIDKAYEVILQRILEQINSLLCFGGHELQSIGSRYIIRKVGETVSIQAPIVKIVDRTYIKQLAERANKDIEEGNYDSAITKARTLLEETFCYVIEKKGDEPTTSGDMGKLYGQVKKLYNMHADRDQDKRINTLLSGLEKIISAISEMRNKESDSHGVGQKRRGVSDYHTRLFVNSAIAMADFILAIYLNAVK